MSVLISRLLALHDAFSLAGVPHAFGGAIALGYCTMEPRGTRDLDVNVFVDAARATEVLATVPSGVAVTAADRTTAGRDGQVRLWWEDTPIDLFFDTVPFHRDVAERIRWVPLAGRTIPVLGCSSLAVFKALFDRSKDWVDIEEMVEARSVDVVDAAATVARLAGNEHPSVGKLLALEKR